MARHPTGKVIEHQGTDGRIYRSLRFTAYKRRRYVSLGAVSAGEAARELRHVLADVERGTWQPPREVEAPPEPVSIPTFHGYAEQWWLRNEGRLAAKTRKDYRWRLESHLLPFFKDCRLDAITFDAVERYIAGKLGEDEPLGARAINMTVTLLAAIMETAVERDLIVKNPAKGKGRRVRERAPSRSYLETAEQIAALLDAAGELDRAPNVRCHNRRVTVAVFVFTGLRIGELIALRWRDVDLAGGWLHVGESKTDAGRRHVKIRGALRDELLSAKAVTAHSGPEDYVVATLKGGRHTTTKVRTDKLAPCVKRASERLIEGDASPLPTGITPHSLRRTFCSLLYALGEDPGVVMDEMGHTDPALALRVYRQAMRRGEGEKTRLRTLVEGSQMAVIGRRAFDAPADTLERRAA